MTDIPKWRFIFLPTLHTFFFHYICSFICLFIVFLRECVCGVCGRPQVSQNICSDERSTLGGWFSPSTTWVLRIDLRLGSKRLFLLNHLAGPPITHIFEYYSKGSEVLALQYQTRKPIHSKWRITCIPKLKDLQLLPLMVNWPGRVIQGA